MFQEILVPVDGSKHSLNAARAAVEIAEKHGGQVTLLHVVNRSHLVTMGSPESVQAVTEAAVECGEKILQDTLKKVKSKTVNIEKEMVWGIPAQIILKKAKEKPYSLIVVGSRGLGQIKGFLLGSVSDQVAREASCPVLIVKGIL